MTFPLDTKRYDEFFRLVGDEDCGVGLDCRLCDRGGAPIAYYPGISQPYPTTVAPDVIPADTISALFEAGQQHLWDRHP